MAVPGRLFLSIIGVIFLLPKSAFSGATVGVDAPDWIWKSPDWDINDVSTDTDPVEFGDPTEWITGDGECGNDNHGYQFQLHGKIYYLDLYKGEMDKGYIISKEKKYVISEQEGCPFSSDDRANLPDFPLSELIGTFRSPFGLESSEHSLVVKLKNPDSIKIDGNVKIYHFEWSANKYYEPDRSNWDVRTILDLGFVHEKLEYVNVHRYWEG